MNFDWRMYILLGEITMQKYFPAGLVKEIQTILFKHPAIERGFKPG